MDWIRRDNYTLSDSSQYHQCLPDSIVFFLDISMTTCVSCKVFVLLPLPLIDELLELLDRYFGFSFCFLHLAEWMIAVFAHTSRFCHNAFTS